MANNIILTGFMAVGKGHVARELARTTGMYALDSDDLVESLTNMKVSQIFEKFGEDYFRLLERQTASWFTDNVKNTILSTGGGFVYVPHLKKLGRVVYLHNQFDSIVSTVYEHPKAERKIRKRPLLTDLEKARVLYEKRLPLYRKNASMEVDVNGKAVSEVADEIIKRLKLKYSRQRS